MNGAGTGEDKQPRIAMGEDIRNLVAGVEDGCRRGFADGTFFLKEDRGQNDFGPFDAKVFRAVEHGSLPGGAHPSPTSVQGMMADDENTLHQNLPA
jgi:hypothetical protein